MNIARPPGGFHVVVAPAVDEYAALVSKDHHGFDWRCKSVLLRLSWTAHREGSPVTDSVGERAAVFDMDDWAIKVAWRVLGDTVTVLAAEF